MMGVAAFLLLVVLGAIKLWHGKDYEAIALWSVACLIGLVMT